MTKVKEVDYAVPTVDDLRACARLPGGDLKYVQNLEDALTTAHVALRSADKGSTKDAARYRWLHDTFSKAVGGGIEVNDARLVYEEPEPGRAVRLYWYPHTPVGFNESAADTLDEAVDGAMPSQYANKEKP